jgi:hypothetical protein
VAIAKDVRAANQIDEEERCGCSQSRKNGVID